MFDSLRHPERALLDLSNDPRALPWGRWVALGAGAVGGSLVYGAGLGLALPGSAARRSALRLTFATGPSWVVLGVVSWLLLRPRGISLWALAQCCLVTMNYGIAVLLGGTPGNIVLAAQQRKQQALGYNLLVIGLSNITMLWIFVQQLHALGVPRWQGALLWMLLLNGCGAALFAVLGVLRADSSL